MKLISTTSRVNYVAKRKNNNKRGCEAQKQMQLKFVGIRSGANYVAQRKNNDK